MQFGIFSELQLPRPWRVDSERVLLPRGPRSDRDRRPARVRLRVAGRAPLPRGVQPQFGARGVPRRGESTNDATSASGTASCSSPPTIRRVSPSASPPSTSSAMVASSSGIGEGASTTELHPFDRRVRDKRLVWEDAVRCIVPMFSEERWEYHGDWFDFPKRNVVPKPVQRPHPPLWVACSQLETIEMAAHRGLGALGFQFVSGDAARAWVNHYYRTFAAGPDRLADYATNPNIALGVRVHVRTDRRGGDRPRRRLDVLPVRAALLQHRASGGNVRAGAADPAVAGVPRAGGSHRRELRRSAATRSSGRPRRCASGSASGRRRTSIRSSCSTRRA